MSPIWAAGAVWLLLKISDSHAQEELAGAAAPAIPRAQAGRAFKPGMAVMVAMVTAFFCITFLALLYARHCSNAGGGGGQGVVSYSARKNSGVQRSLVESLPVFRFASLRGQKEGLECAVCLSCFEPAELLRLLPKCNHAFHVECVDTWLDAHSTCPLCRYRVRPEDLLLALQKPIGEAAADSSTRRVSGRHSSAGERGAGRKDGLLHITQRKVDHRIIISGPGPGPAHDCRWSDVLPSDLLYLRSELLINGGSASDVPGDRETRDAPTLARWTARISQPTSLTPS